MCAPPRPVFFFSSITDTLHLSTSFFFVGYIFYHQVNGDCMFLDNITIVFGFIKNAIKDIKKFPNE